MIDFDDYEKPDHARHFRYHLRMYLLGWTVLPLRALIDWIESPLESPVDPLK